MQKKITAFEIKLIQIYILLMPFISAFALNPWMPLPLLFMIVVALYVLISYQFKFFKEDIDFFLIIILGILGLIFATDYFGSKNINHIAAAFSSIFFLYMIPKSLVTKLKSIKVLGTAFAISLGVVSAFVIVEFISSNYFGINFIDFIPYTRTDLADALVAGTFIRPRGFAEEAGHMAVFYELALPLSLLYFKDKSFIFQLCYYIPILASFILLFSAAAFIALPIALILVSLLTPRSKGSFALLAVLSVFIIVIFSSDVTRPFVESTVGMRLETFVNPSEQSNSSAMDRSDRYRNAFNLFLSAPLGIGWGMSSQLASDNQAFAGVVLETAGLISLYAEILVACGLLGLLLFLRFLGKKIFRLAKLRTFESQLVLISVLSISLHYIFISNYWFPMLWFSLALADTVSRNEKKMFAKTYNQQNVS